MIKNTFTLYLKEQNKQHTCFVLNILKIQSCCLEMLPI